MKKFLIGLSAATMLAGNALAYSPVENINPNQPLEISAIVYEEISPLQLSTSLGLFGNLGTDWRSSPNAVWPSANGSIGLSVNVTNNRSSASNFQWRIERRNANGSWSPVWTSGNISVGANATVTLNPASRGVSGNANYRVAVRGSHANAFNLNWGTVTFR